MKRLLPLVGVLLLASTTPNMGLNKPAPNDTSYRSKIDTILNQVDSHDHTTGKGVQVPSGGIATGAVTSEKILDGSIGTADYALGSVTTQILADRSVTAAKKALMTTGQYVGKGGLAIGPSAVTYTTTGTSSEPTGAPSIGIDTTGRPLVLGLQGTSASVCSISATSSDCKLKLVPNSGSTLRVQFSNDEAPCSALWVINPVSAGSYVYSMELDRDGVSGTCSVTNAVLFGYEL